MFVFVRVSYLASALTVLTDDFNQIIYYRTRRTRLRLIETKIFLINYKATPAAQQQSTGSSSGISKNLLFSYNLHRQSQRRRRHRLTSATRLGSVPAFGSPQSALSLFSGFALKAVGARVFGITLCAAGVSASVVVDVAQPFGPPLRYTHKQICTHIHTYSQAIYVVRRCLYVFYSALCHAHSYCFVRLPFASQSLPLPLWLSLRCCPTACCSQRPSHTNTRTCAAAYGCTYFSFSFCLCSPHSLRLMLLLFAAYGFVRRRCRLRCHSCQCCLPASFHTSSLLPLLLLLATSLYGSVADVSASLPFFPLVFVRFVAHFLRFISFLSYPRLSLCLFVHKCISASVCVCVAARKLIIML